MVFSFCWKHKYSETEKKAPLSFKTLESATARIIWFFQSKWAAIPKVKLVGTVGARRRFKLLDCHHHNLKQENLFKKKSITLSHEPTEQQKALKVPVE